MSLDASGPTDAEFYPMPLFVQLTVSDLPASVEWYRALGFDAVYELPVMAHLRYRPYADVMLVADGAGVGSVSEPGETERGRGVSVYLTLEDESVDDVATRADTAGVDRLDGPHETSWNTRELTVTDPDGYGFVFSEVVDADRTFESAVGSQPKATEATDAAEPAEPTEPTDSRRESHRDD